MSFPSVRLRRLRHHPGLRSLIRETHLCLSDLVLPLFIKGEEGEKKPIKSLPGHFQIPLNRLAEEIEECMSLGITSVILFGVPSLKDAYGSESFSETGIIQKAVRLIRKLAPELLVITDCCFCEYTTHGHCGLVNAEGVIDNDETLPLLVKQAVAQAAAGAQVIAPSGMVDGMVGQIRQGLDQAGFSHIPILSYAIKYNSSMYGPFRDAAEGAPQHGDRSSHQMDFANRAEALREACLDVEEGADMLMVKPAHTYLDIIQKVKENHSALPLGAYHTSGEFAMLKAAAEKGWIDEKKAALEVLCAIRRAGADFIITYYAKELASLLRR
jgi:porphobilinogen synthase